MKVSAGVGGAGRGREGTYVHAGYVPVRMIVCMYLYTVRMYIHMYIRTYVYAYTLEPLYSGHSQDPSWLSCIERCS